MNSNWKSNSIPNDVEIIIYTPQGNLSDTSDKFSKEDGRFLIFIDSEKTKIYGKYLPPLPGGKNIPFGIVRRAINEVGGEEFFIDNLAIDNLLSAKYETSFEVIAFKKDAEMSIEISPDNLKAFFSYSPAYGGKKITFEEVEDYLNERGICYNVNYPLIREILAKNNAVNSVLIAEGKPPKEGKDGEIKLFFEVKSKKLQPLIEENGNVDFYELSLFNNVRAGDVLAIKSNATNGEPGISVFGKEIPAKKGKDVHLIAGSNVARTKGEQFTLIATNSGEPRFDGHRISVQPILVIEKDVDFSVGNINFLGDVIVRGNVKDGFKIKALGDVSILGSVEIAYIEAEGNVIVKRGIHGHGKALVSCKGNLIAKFIDHTTVYSESNVIVDELIFNSKINAFKSIILRGAKGELIGGISRAGLSISAKQIGSKMLTLTKIEIGANPKLREDIEKFNDEISYLNKEVLSLSSLIEKRKKISSVENLNALKNMIAKRSHLQVKIRQLNEELNLLLKRIDDTPSSFLKVNVRGTVYPNVHIVIKRAFLKTTDYLKSATFYESNGKIEVMSYNP